MVTTRPPSLLRTLRLIAFAATLLGAVPFVSSLLFYKNALLTTGVVVELAPNNALLEPKTTPVMAFVDYRRQKWLASPASALGTEGLRPGQEQRIRYDPLDPLNFRIGTPLGMWGAGVIRLLIGLVPLLLLSAIIANTQKALPKQRPRLAAPPRSKAIKPAHLIRHKNAPPADTGVVRRMR